MRILDNIVLLLVCFITGLFTGCGFDDDREYEVRTRAAFLVQPGAVVGGRQINRIDAEGMTLNWLASQGFAGSALGAVALNGGNLYLGNLQDNYIYEVDAAGTPEGTRIGTSIRPHSLAVGEKYYLVADSISEQIEFIERNDDFRVTLEMPGAPLKVLYNGGRFYLQIGTQRVEVWDELALTIRDGHDLDFSIQDMGFDPFKNIILVVGDGTNDYRRILSGVNNTLGIRNQVPYRSIEFSPYFDARFGSEWLSPVQLSPAGELSSGNLVFAQNISTFTVDFFESILYYSDRDSIYRVDMNTLDVLDKWSWFGIGDIQEGLFWLGE